MVENVSLDGLRLPGVLVMVALTSSSRESERSLKWEFIFSMSYLNIDNITDRVTHFR